MTDTATTAAGPMPAEARRYLAQVRRRLWALPAADRHETIAGIVDHIEDALARGESASEVLAGLGAPELVATQSAAEFEARTGRVAYPRFLNPARILQLLAFAYCALVAGYQLVWVQGIDTSGRSGGDAVSMMHLVLHGEVAWPGVLPTVLPAMVALVAVLLVGRAWRPGIAVVAVLLLVMCLSNPGQGFDPFLGTLLTWLPALALELAALFVPYRAKAASAH